MSIDPKSTPSEVRTRITVDVAPEVALLLDHISSFTGTSRSQLVLQAVTDSLPAWLDLADTIKRRSGELARAAKGSK